jgi:glycerol kinase
MSDGAVLAIDQGTSATKAVVLSAAGDVIASAQRLLAVGHGPGGRVELDPRAVWDSVVAAGRQAVAAADEPVDVVGIANQGETVLAWDPVTDAALSPAVVWQDRRAAEVCTRLSAAADRLRELTGLPMNEYFAAPKMSWLRSHGYTGGVVTMLDSWLLHRLTGQFATDAATASRSLLTDLTSGQWSVEALEIFGLGDEALPRIRDCSAEYGTTTAFGSPMRVTAAITDQQAALFGQRCFEPGAAKCTYGTGAFLLANAGTAAPRSTRNLVACLAWSLAGQRTYCLDGQVLTAGSAIRWLQEVGVLTHPRNLDLLAATVPDAGGVRVVPALAGLGAPWWAGTARGRILGIGLDTERGHLVRAVLEGIAAQVACLVAAVEADRGITIPALRVDGGLTHCSTLMQAQADLLQRRVCVFHSPDPTALGVAALARSDPAHAAAASARPPASVYDPLIDAAHAEERMAAFGRLLDDMLAETA